MFQNLDDIRHNISDDVYKFAMNIINENKDKNLRRMYDELNIKSTDIVNKNNFDDYYEIEVIITTRYLKYFIKLDSGDYVSGDRNNRIMDKITVWKERARKIIWGVQMMIAALLVVGLTACGDAPRC